MVNLFFTVAALCFGVAFVLTHLRWAQCVLRTIATAICIAALSWAATYVILLSMTASVLGI